MAIGNALKLANTKFKVFDINCSFCIQTINFELLLNLDKFAKNASVLWTHFILL